MVTISCCGKLHAFALAEQMEKQGNLDRLFTAYAYQKNTWLRKLVKRVDKEKIPPEKITTSSLLAFPMKLLPLWTYTWNNFFDHAVARQIRNSQSKVFIGWSGMSLNAIRAAKDKGMLTIVERGSTHIVFQDEILREEYKRFGKAFAIDKRVVKKEMKEYEEADLISIPSRFVQQSFISKGISKNKLLLNPYGASDFFKRNSDKNSLNDKFTILYLGGITIQKGLIYLFEALKKLPFDMSKYEVWFIGSVAQEMKETIEEYNQFNWKWMGHIPHYELPALISRCHIAVQPSLQEGMSMVIPQMLACGVPVIASANSGGDEIIVEDKTGYIVPIRNPDAIVEKITILFDDREKLSMMKVAAMGNPLSVSGWDEYGERYKNNLARFLEKRGSPAKQVKKNAT
jgi:glycosyltransferase involved in cell wall biosynthesis